jgi:hypothetical protein
MSELMTKMQSIYGSAGMRQPPSRDELYTALDTVTAALKSHKERIDALEDPKPRVRVPAGSKRV